MLRWKLWLARAQPEIGVLLIRAKCPVGQFKILVQNLVGTKTKSQLNVSYTAPLGIGLTRFEALTGLPTPLVLCLFSLSSHPPMVFLQHEQN